MSIEKAYWVFCDGDNCVEQIPWDMHCSEVSQARQLARQLAWQAGWKHLPATQAPIAGDFCPDCWVELQKVRNDINY